MNHTELIFRTPTKGVCWRILDTKEQKISYSQNQVTGDYLLHVSASREVLFELGKQLIKEFGKE